MTTWVFTLYGGGTETFTSPGTSKLAQLEESAETFEEARVAAEVRVPAGARILYTKLKIPPPFED